MRFFALLVVILLIGAAAAAATGRFGPGMAEATSTQSFEGLGTEPVTAQAIDAVRFDQALRGYRMNQVDAVLERLAHELSTRDEELALLRGPDADR